MEHGASSEILPVEVKLESPNVLLLDFGYVVAVFQLLSNLLFFGTFVSPSMGKYFLLQDRI